MARPRKRRIVCKLPNIKVYGPLDGNIHDEPIILSVEEYEVIRLIDLEGLEQEQCAERMGVARSTVQRMYTEAKQKVADSLVNGKILRIEGGDYILCEEDNNRCISCNRGRHRHRRGKMG
ncbi:putative DNA-binding protein (UPF0251 family) [Keratinibaculum paraultunense]|uniref:UPF0251 protein EDD65_10793 n=1 Tax=Keratinibaculum paraultunense TaxID=1278232 RepID=A0A4R3KUF0_9FIRM|nr:DUF134 domain-containing protein [Keratinibaculum paraultunense]QQY79855.1 DUF134 domain-containing protein [Keratinibaculum paraultunense]TCS88738.1 putative DNA-binding protein (UPF0251 family) [Keratinibaculum paraultunense]